MEEKRVKILKAQADSITRKEALEKIRDFLYSEKGHHLITLNSEMIVCAQKDAEFLGIINGADLVVADGMGVLSAASFLGRKTGKFIPDFMNIILIGFYFSVMPERIKNILPEKISGVDLIHDICGSGFMKGKRIYLVGAQEGIAEKTKEILEKKYLGIQIVGAQEGIGRNSKQEENEKLIERINLQQPDLLFIAFGAPKQEKWIHKNLKKMPSVKLAIGVGGSFDIISGKIKRAPKFMQTHGLEWLWRLFSQPQRIKRTYNAALRFSWLIFWDKNDMMGK